MIILFWEEERSQRSADGGDNLELELGSLIIDVVTSETRTIASTVTAHPVEDGAPVSDHIRPDLKRITLECAHSESPISPELEDTEAQTVEVSPGSFAIVTRVTSGESRTENVFSTLQRITDQGILVDVGPLIENVNQFAITSFSPSREVDNSGALFFSLELVEVRRAVVRTAAAPAPRRERGRNRRDRGRQANQNGSSNGTASSDPQNRQTALEQVRSEMAEVRSNGGGFGEQLEAGSAVLLGGFGS